MLAYKFSIALAMLCLILAGCGSTEKSRYSSEELEAMEKYTLLDPKVNPKPVVESLNYCMNNFFIFPAELRGNSRRYRVNIGFDITPDGFIRNHYIIDSEHYLLANAAISMLRNCPFKPGEIDGVPVYVTNASQPIIIQGM